MTDMQRRLVSARVFQVDAFTTRLFGGNPAAVVLVDSFPSDPTMQLIAAENNLPETAFLVADGRDYSLRWFTPTVEVPLCGHATLASAAVVLERLEPGRVEVVFNSISGPLPVRRHERDYLLNFPAQPPEPVRTPVELSSALGIEPSEVLINSFNYLAVFDDEQTVRDLAPNMNRVATLDRAGVIATAPATSNEADFVSRYFAPQKGIPEDPVTGGAHCMLTPYWHSRTGKTKFRAHQASTRGGDLSCELVGNRVELRGSCVFYLDGTIQF